MQNTNEHRNIITISDQHTNSNSNSQAPNQLGQMENDLFPVVLGESQKGETLQNGYSADRLLDSQNHQIFVEENMTRSEIMEQIKKTDDLLDDICLSDEEEPVQKLNINNDKMITQSEYNQEMKKISELYDEDESMNKYTGTRNEQEVRKEIPMPFELTVNDILAEAGMIEDIFEDKIIMRANIFNGILDLDNIMFNENKFPVGYLDDVIGKVESPYYVVRFFPNLTEESKQKMGLIPGKSIFFAKTKSKQVLPNYLMKHKGCDASNAFDEEIQEDEMEFSDDEEEVKFKSRRKARKQSHNVEGMKVDPEDGPRFNFNEKGNSKKQKVSLEEYYGFEGSLGGNVSSVTNKVSYNNNIYSTSGNNTNIQTNTMNQISSGNPIYSSEYKLNSQGMNMNNNIFNNTQFQQANQGGFPFNMGMPNTSMNMNNFNMLNLMMLSMNNQANPMVNPMGNPMTNPMVSQMSNNVNMSYNPMMQNFNNTQTQNTNQPNNVNSQYPIQSPFPSVNPFQPPTYKK
jgi:rRNA processing protein Gar1